MSKVLSQSYHFLPHLTNLSMRELSEVRNSLHVNVSMNNHVLHAVFFLSNFFFACTNAFSE